MEGNNSANKRKISTKNDENDDKVYRFQVLLPNGLNVQVIKRNPVNEFMSLATFVEKVKERCNLILRQTSNVEVCVNSKREILWSSKELYLEDGFGMKIRGDLCYDKFKPNKIHFLRLFDGAGHTVDSFQNMWDLTPDTDLLSELPDDYTFETALADLIDNSLQAVWSNSEGERKLISIEINDDKVSVFDTGPGMDGSAENSVAKWGKMGASLHRSSKKQAIGGKPPFLRPFFGMFGYGGTIASMHLGRHAIVSAKTKESKKVYWLRLERDALLKRAGSSSLINWKAPGGIRDPTDDETEKSEHGSFLKVEMKPKLKVPDLFKLQCKLKDIYFPYIQCDEMAGRTATFVEFEVNDINLAEIDGGEVAITNLHSCNGPDFILDIHFSTEEDMAAVKGQSKNEANARLKCVYFPIIEGKENIERILEKLNADGCGIKEDFQTFSRISIRRLGRLLPDARWDLLPFMRPKQKRGEKLLILKRICSRVKCFIDTDAGFNPIPSKTDLALHHPFTRALRELGGDTAMKGVKCRILRGGKQLSPLQLEREYQAWVHQMHNDYDEEFSGGDDEPIVLINLANKEELGITSNVVRVHEAVTRKGRSWNRGQKIKILKGACPGCHKANIYATVEYFLLENLQGDAGGEARIICRPRQVQVQDGAKLTDEALELHSSISVPITVIDSGKCVALNNEDWNSHVEKLNLKLPSSIEVLGLKQCKALDIDGALPSGAVISAGLIPPKEVVAVLRPANFPSSTSTDELDPKYIVKESYEMCMEVTFKAAAAESPEADHIFSASVANTSRRGCNGLYIFPLLVPQLFQKAGIYSFSFSLKNSASTRCQISIKVKACSEIKTWKLSEDDDTLPFDVSVGSYYPSFSVERYDRYGNCVAFNSVPDILCKLMSDRIVLSPIKSAMVELSADKLQVTVKNVRVMTDNLDKIRPSYKATLVLSLRDKSDILSIPCRVFPGAPKSLAFHLSESGNCWLPRQVVDEIKLEIFDRHNNHVKEGLEVELQVHGFCFVDGLGHTRKVDDQGFVDLGGALKVTEGYGNPVSVTVLYNKQVLQVKKFHVEKRLLRMVTEVPEVCHAGSKLKHVVFEVVDPDGSIDQTIHNDDKHSPPHILKIRTGSAENDSARYVFKKGRCVVPSITLPKRKGDFFIEAVHSHYPELHLKFKTAVSHATDETYDLTCDLQASKENDDFINRFSNDRVTPDPVSDVIATRTAPKVHDKKVYKQPVQERAFSSPSRTSDPKKASEKSAGSFMDHPGTNQFENMATSTEKTLTDDQEDSKNTPILTQTPMRHYGSNDKHDDHMFKSPESKVTCVDPFTPGCTGKLLLSELDDILDDIHVCGSRIKEHEDRLEYYESRKNVFQDLICKDHEELSQLQATMEPVPLSMAYCMSQEEAVVEKIEKKVESAAALYSFVSRDSSLRDQYSMFMDDVVGLVALIGTAPTHSLSRSLAEYLGEDQMLAVVCRSNAAMRRPGTYELELKSIASELGTCIRGSHLFICLEDIRAFPGRLIEDGSQKRLSLPNPSLPDGTTPPGFLGFAVNMIDIAAKHLNTKTSSGHGLRETLFYRLFGELQVYDTKEDMQEAYCCGCAKDGALSLDGGIVRGSGMITLGCKEVDVHFPVIAEKNQLVPFCETSSLEELEEMVKKKQQQIEDNKAELILVEEAIIYLSQQRSEELHEFHEKKASYLKLLEAKEMSLSQSQRSPIPIDLDSPGL
ncbi:structural maintenance of chromosomes flexible hinge domain-containing protein GMI1 [Silene latifolia]|uniref:structural maintenance of chromosomes flexible hinge domain-containing protein GMI1 n=1 Tax=Silene latifolia TaxID=37657 RepID=UPI003D777D39